MVYNDKKFDLMVESAWRAFESTLMLHGMSRGQVELFHKYLVYRSVNLQVRDELEGVVEWEDE